MHDVAIKTLTSGKKSCDSQEGRTWQANKQHSARARSVCQSSDLFWEDAPLLARTQMANWVLMERRLQKRSAELRKSASARGCQ